MHDSFAKAFDCHIYRLKNESQRYNFDIASKVAKFVKMLRPQLKETDFEEMDLISILAFLKKVLDACNSIAIHEEVATRLFSYIVKNQYPRHLRLDRRQR